MAKTPLTSLSDPLNRQINDACIALRLSPARDAYTVKIGGGFVTIVRTRGRRVLYNTFRIIDETLHPFSSSSLTREQKRDMIQEQLMTASWSQIELARMFGVAPSTVSHYHRAL